MPNDALTNVAPTGIYLLRGVPRELQRAARRRALDDGTTLRSVLLRALREYAASTWTPRPEDITPVAVAAVAAAVVALPSAPAGNNRKLDA